MSFTAEKRATIPFSFLRNKRYALYALKGICMSKMNGKVIA